MNTLLGTIIIALVTDENDRFYFVQKDGVTFALAKDEGEHAIGDMVKGFAYTDSKQKLRQVRPRLGRGKRKSRQLENLTIGERSLMSEKI